MGSKVRLERTAASAVVVTARPTNVGKASRAQNGNVSDGVIVISCGARAVGHLQHPQKSWVPGKAHRRRRVGRMGVSNALQSVVDVVAVGSDLTQGIGEATEPADGVFIGIARPRAIRVGLSNQT